MLSQYRNKIIALFASVCLLATLLCLPVSAADEPATMLYNGVELPVIPVDSQRPYVLILAQSTGSYPYKVGLSKYPFVYYADAYEGNPAGSILVPNNVSGAVKAYRLSDSSWSYYISSDDYETFCLVNPNNSQTILWSNIDIYDSDGHLYYETSLPVPPGGITGSVSIDSVQTLDDSASFVLSVSDLTESVVGYTVKVFRYIGDTLDGEFVSDAFAGPSATLHLTAANLEPETEYRIVFKLQYDGEDTEISAVTTITTLAAEVDNPVDDTDSLSILSAIFAAINDQNDRQEQEHESLLSVLSDIWIRLRYIEENTAEILLHLKAIAPSAEETALKEAAKETTQAVTDSLYADDAPTKVTASDVKDLATSGTAVVNTFDTGATVGDFFAVFSDYVFTGWFSEETRANLDSVNAVSTFRLGDDPYNHDSYNKNMEALDKFLERSGK